MEEIAEVTRSRGEDTQYSGLQYKIGIRELLGTSVPPPSILYKLMVGLGGWVERENYRKIALEYMIPVDSCLYWGCLWESTKSATTSVLPLDTVHF